MRVTHVKAKEAPPAPKFAEPADVTKMAEGLTDEFLQCRDFGHQWQPLSVDYHRKMQVYERRMLCGRCSAHRVQRLGRSGAMLGTVYEYPEDYLSKGLGRMGTGGRDALRLASTLRIYDTKTNTKTSRSA